MISGHNHRNFKLNHKAVISQRSCKPKNT
jgi:hypothetical protein